MRLTVVSINGEPPLAGQSVRFEAPGGTIGRSPDNTLVLPDDSRKISRLQASVRLRADGRRSIRNLSAVAHMAINEQVLGPAEERDLQPGDAVTIGAYRLRVEAASSASLTELAAPPKSKASAPADEAFWASLVHEFAPAPLSSTPQAVTGAIQHADPEALNAQIPQARDHGFDSAVRVETIDWHTPVATPASEPGIALTELRQLPTDPLALFGGDAAGHAGGSTVSTLAAASSLMALESPTPSTAHNLLHSLMTGRAATADMPPTSQRDSVADWHAAIRLGSPVAKEAPPATVPQTPIASPIHLPDAAPPETGDLRTGGVEIAHTHAEAAPQPPREAIASAQHPAQGGAQEATQGATQEAAQSPDQRPAQSAESAMTTGAPLIQAFLQGAGISPLPAQRPPSEASLFLAGKLLALFAEGTVQLLSSRALLKHEVRADMTMVLDKENNPFKLLPDGQTVLRQMFGAALPGFLTPEQAVTDAFGDINAHHIGMVAGMRAALLALLRDFDPQRIAHEHPATSLSQRLSLAQRKAQWWDELVAIHRQTTQAVEDDFNSVFGRTFLEAYDAEVENCRRQRRKA